MQFGLIEAVRHWAKYRRNEIALLSNGDSITYGALFDQCESVARGVLQHGSNGCVAVVAQRKPLFLSALLGVMRAGRSVVIVNPTLSNEALGVVVSKTEPTLLVEDRYNAEVWTPDAFSDISRLVVEDVPSDGEISWPAYEPHDEWGIVFSSGSTGAPKGILRNHDSMVAEVLGWCLELSIRRGSTFYIGRPLFYTGGLVLALATLFAGATIVANDYDDDNNPEEVWTDYQRELTVHNIEMSFFVPEQLRDFTRWANETAAGSPIPHADTVLVMGSPISGEEKRTARRVLGSNIIESWGNSESLGTITEADDLDRRPDSVGRPFLTDDLFVVVDRSSSTLCQPHERGFLAGSEVAGFAEYANLPEATRFVKHDGLIVSDDIGYCDEDGYFYLVGREQDVVFRYGEAVLLPRVAEKIRTYEQIEAAEVVAVDASADGELRAAVVLETGCDTEPAILCDRLNGQLAIAEQLSRIVVVDEIPLLGAGKVDRLAIRKLCGDVETDE